MPYVLARTASKRPSLQHRLLTTFDGVTDFDTTACGKDVSGWSRAYQAEIIPQIYCIHCLRSHR